jgi:hypothetical protein
MSLALLLMLTAAPAPPAVPAAFDLTDDLMKSTFFLIGTEGQRGSFGTGFILIRPFPNDSKHGEGFLITAAHVFESMPSDAIEIVGHAQTAVGWTAAPIPLQIREGKDHRPLWTRHPHADVAALPLSKKKGLPAGLPTTLLLGADAFGGSGLQTGDELRVLGFPLGQDSQPPGFALLRSGRIASYLTGTSGSSTFLLDFPIFPGNSGGPVFVDQRGVAGRPGRFQGIVGLVDQELVGPEEEAGPHGVSTTLRSIGIAKIIRSSTVRELVNQMP